jgi:selenocysteine lyase/cysteine desulfurase
MPAFDPHAVRPRFPALAQEASGRPAVFFDAPGGTQVPQPVIDAIGAYLAHSNANTHGAFATSQRTDVTIAAAHQAMADLLGCAPGETVFGANMTTLNFALSRAIGRELGPGDEIVVTRLDHDANVAPWRALEERGVTIHEVDVDVEDCTLDWADFEAKVNARTRLVALGYASNAVRSRLSTRCIMRPTAQSMWPTSAAIFSRAASTSSLAPTWACSMARPSTWSGCTRTKCAPLPRPPPNAG